MSAEYLFISDCHLDTSRPEAIRALSDFLEHRANSATRIYILGDLFEVWLGDDDPAAGLAGIIESIKRRARATSMFFMAGNRDFLLGAKFAAEIGVELLPETFRLELGHHSTLLLHGDTLCTDDEDYQAFRRQMRNPAWQTRFLARPLVERQEIAAGLRSDSSKAMSTKSMQIMDVNPETVESCFDTHGVDTLIHGHTHRPAVHHYANGATRYVLGDWNPDPSYLSWRQDLGFELIDPRV